MDLHHFNADPDPAPHQDYSNHRPLAYIPSSLHFEPPRLHLSLHDSILSLESSWTLTLTRIRIQLFTLIRIQLPKTVRIQIWNPGLSNKSTTPFPNSFSLYLLSQYILCFTLHLTQSPSPFPSPLSNLNVHCVLRNALAYVVSLFEKDGRKHGGRHQEDVVQVLQQADQPQDAALPHLHQGGRTRHQPRQDTGSVFILLCYFSLDLSPHTTFGESGVRSHAVGWILPFRNIGSGPRCVSHPNELAVPSIK